MTGFVSTRLDSRDVVLTETSGVSHKHRRVSAQMFAYPAVLARNQHTRSNQTSRELG